MFLQVEASNWFWLVISILTIWRLTTLICYEAGPFNVMTKLRGLLYRIKLGSLVECFHCTAFWISLFIILSIYRINVAAIFIWIATAGGASIIEKIISNRIVQQHEEDEETD